MTPTPGFVGILGSNIATTGPDSAVTANTEVTLFSTTLPLNALGAGSEAEIRIVGEVFNQSGAGRNLTIRAYLGTTAYFVGTDGQAGAANKRYLNILARVLGRTANTQVGNFYFEVGAADTVNGSGANSFIRNQSNHNAMVEDSTTNLVFKITAAWNFQHASLYAYSYAARCNLYAP